MGQIVNIPELVAVIIAFVIFYWIVKRFVWPGFLRTLDERAEKIQKTFDEIEATRQEMETLKRDYAEHLKQIESEAQEKIREAIDQGRHLAEGIRADAESQREKLLSKARADIERERDIAKEELRRYVIEMAFEITEKVLKESVDRERQRKLVESFLKEMEAIPSGLTGEPLTGDKA